VNAHAPRISSMDLSAGDSEIREVLFMAFPPFV